MDLDLGPCVSFMKKKIPSDSFHGNPAAKRRNVPLHIFVWGGLDGVCRKGVPGISPKMGESLPSLKLTVRP